jgi:eukaryotic-like serine/threonine-protein kinase
VPEGTVLRTDPPAGTALAVGAPVTLVVSRGVRPAPARVVVPLVIGDRADDAAEDLAELGLRVEIEEGFPFGDRDGVVVDQAPDPGTPVPPGTTVVLSTAGF